MKKEVIGRGLLGFPLGIALGFVIPLVISLCYGDGNYYPVHPDFQAAAGSEVAAVAVQTLLAGIMGSGFAMASVIWQLDSWSLAKQSGVYFFIASVLMFPIAYAAHWMEHSLAGIASYAAIFVGIFLAIWVIGYLGWRKKVKNLNAAVGSEEG